MTPNLSILTGCMAGATESFVVVPFELVKIKLQDKASSFAGPMDVVRKTVAKEGLLGLYVGMESTFWRHWWWNGGYFGTIFQVKALMPKAEVSTSYHTSTFRNAERALRRSKQSCLTTLCLVVLVVLSELP